MTVFDLINRLFGKESACSKDVAKERLRLVLVHDRADTSPQFMEGLKDDMIKVISKYMDINEENMEVRFAHTETSVALIANIPVNNMKRGKMPKK